MAIWYKNMKNNFNIHLPFYQTLLKYQFFFFYTEIPISFVEKKAGVLDYETFAKSLEALEAWIVEAEEILQGQDPSHSSDLSTIQERMEELKVSVFKSESQTFYHLSSKSFSFFFFFFWDGVSLCRPGWSAVESSQLTVASASWAQVILPPQPPE